MTPDQAIGMILFTPVIITCIIGALVEWAANKIKAKKKAEAEAQARKAYNDSLFFLDICGDCKYYETI